MGLVIKNNLTIGAYNNNVFNPLDISGLELYLNRNTATVSSWVDQSPNAFDFVQATAIQQPTLATNSVDFDGVDDIMEEIVADAYIGDSSGYIFVSGFFNSAGDNNILSSGDTGGRLFKIGILPTGELFVQAASGTNDLFHTTTQITNGAYYYGYIRSTGSVWEINLNGVNETLIGLVGVNLGRWFAYVTSRENLTVGALHTSTFTYGYAKINKILYSNAALTSGEIAGMQSFMSDPTN